MADKLSENMEDRQDYARRMYEFLKEMGIDDRMKRSRIFKAAGPGQVKEAWKLANCEDFTSNLVRKNTLLCILGGSKRVEISREEMEEVLEASGFYVPSAHNNRNFFRTLNGAGEILMSGFFKFSYADMQEIKEGLAKKVHED